MKTFTLSTALVVATAGFALAQENPAPSREGGYGLGRTALPEEIAAWDIDIRPDGTGLPVGLGDVYTGEELFVDLCSACHGDFGEAVGRWPQLAGGYGTLESEDPVKTIGSYWPYLSTVWDYVHRAMPYGSAQSLTDDEVYAIVAYLMYVNDMVDDDFELSNENFLEIAMPNEDNFFMDDRAETEYTLFTGEPCMENCRESVEITARATILNVTPEQEAAAAAEAAAAEAAAAAEEAAVVEAAAEEAVAEEAPGPDPALVAQGETLFRQCASCHQIGEGATNRTGPMLNHTYGAPVGVHEGFRYSPAFQAARDSGMVWDDASLTAYLMDPRGFIPGNRMAFRGLRSEEEAAAMIAYLRAAGGDAE
ncbi:c-type cytochrome [Roseibacterium sp. KMU-115]|uniref:C-type cytochrome n=2 Tax=Roseicyclus persicicus TaxID=2650661 RepID=A0A7X6H0J0_9RHOB|nr:c-type cytochrome [Roseibacterium persicicum]NKX45740.1 c-type cytochrome [Roseibacterium persicicum]